MKTPKAQYRIEAIEVRHPGPTSVLRGAPVTAHHRSDWSPLDVPSPANVEAWVRRYLAAARADTVLSDLLGLPDIQRARIFENDTNRVVASWSRPVTWSV